MYFTPLILEVHQEDTSLRIGALGFEGMTERAAWLHCLKLFKAGNVVPGAQDLGYPGLHVLAWTPDGFLRALPVASVRRGHSGTLCVPTDPLTDINSHSKQLLF